MADAQTYAGSKLYICTTPQTSDLTSTTFAALTWVEVKGVGNVGEWSTTPNVLSYPTVSDTVTQKQKGMDNGGDPKIELKYDPSDAGQTAVKAAALTTSSYAFKLLLASGKVWYNRGVVGGPERPGGGNEDFIREVYTLGFQQKTVEV